jgi:hypothetical protein
VSGPSTRHPGITPELTVNQFSAPPRHGNIHMVVGCAGEVDRLEDQGRKLKKERDALEEKNEEITRELKCVL